MTKAYSLDLREKIVQARLSGKHTRSEIAKIFSVGVSSVTKFCRQFIETGSLEAKKQPGRPPKILISDKKLINKYVLLNPEASLQDYCDMLELDTGKVTCLSNMHLIITELNITRKKKSVRSRTGS